MLPIQRITSTGLPIEQVLQGIKSRGWVIDTAAGKLVSKVRSTNLSPPAPSAFGLVAIEGQALSFGSKWGDLWEKAKEGGYVQPTVYDSLLLLLNFPPFFWSAGYSKVVMCHHGVLLPRENNPYKSRSHVLRLELRSSLPGVVSIERAQTTRSIDYSAVYLFQIV